MCQTKGYKKKNGHRQSLTEIQIENILASGAKKAAPAKAKAKPASAKAEKATPVAPKAKAETKVKTPAAKPAKSDDLKKIEGAGPKAAEALVAAGLDTFSKVAKSTPDALSTILTDASSRLSHLVTTSWPEQAQPFLRWTRSRLFLTRWQDHQAH